MYRWGSTPLQVSVFCSAPIQAGFSAPRPLRRESGCTCYLSHIHSFTHSLRIPFPDVLVNSPTSGVPAQGVGTSMDYDHRFDPPRPPVFVEGGGASPAGWPLHCIIFWPCTSPDVHNTTPRHGRATAPLSKPATMATPAYVQGRKSLPRAGSIRAP